MVLAMGAMVEGRWEKGDSFTASPGAAFVRAETVFRDRVEAQEGARFRAEPDRYHLYVSYACPWAHRTLIVRAMKGLEDVLPVTVVEPFMGDEGWSFAQPEPLFGARHLHEIYRRAAARYTGRVTVPVLWDKREGTIVSNESAEILRMLDAAFDAFATRPLAPLYPEAHREAIDAINARVYETVNNGVYRAGFAREQSPYDEAVAALFETLDALEVHLATRTFLVGDALTEADVRLFTTLARFDAVYVGHFKCNLRRLVDYPNLWAYARRIYQLPRVAETVRFDHIKEHYYRSHGAINPTRIVPRGPVVDWSAPP